MADYTQYIQNASEKYGVDANLIKAVIQVESSGNPNAVSSAGAEGLMQIMPSTFNSLTGGVGNAFNAEDNINAGTKYLAQLLKNSDGDVTQALACYNAGAGNVAKYGAEKYSSYTNSVLSAYKSISGTEYSTTNISTESNNTKWYYNVIKVIIAIILIIIGVAFLALSVSGFSSIEDIKKKAIKKVVE